MTWKKTVLILGTASFFTDVGSEMIYPLLPVFLSQTLGASAFQLGVIEGFAEAIASIMKVVSGIWSDRAKRKKPIIVSGYSLSGIIRPVISIAHSWYFVLLVRFIDRVGKGLRTSPRDALVADITDHHQRGRAFGLHRAMDHAGAVAGPLLAAAIMAIPGVTLRNVFALSLIPGIITILVLAFGLKEKEAEKLVEKTAEEKISFKGLYGDWVNLGANYRKFLLAVLVFTLGNATDAFLLLRLSDLGISPAGVASLWAAHNSIKMFTTYFGGRVSDKIGHRNSIFFGWIIYAFTYFIMGSFDSKAIVICAFLFYGVFFGFVEPGERAFVPELVKAERRGTAYGYFHFVIGLMALPASIGFGYVWQEFGAQTAFNMGAVLALFAAGLLTRCAAKQN